MNLLFYPVFSLLLLVFQTTLVPEVSFLKNSFDFVIINVLYVGLFTSRFWVVIYVAGLGWVMDSLSGAPFGFFISSYVWIYVLVQALRVVVHAGNIFFIPLISVVAILMEHGFLMFILMIRQEAWSFSVIDCVAMVKQAVVGGAVIPLLLFMIHRIHREWEKSVFRFSERKWR